MKRGFLLPILLFMASIVSAQTISYSISGVANKKIFILGATGTKNSIEIGEKVTLLNLQSDATYNNYLTVKLGESTLKIAPADVKKITFDNPTTNRELWQIVRMKSDVDGSLLSKGYQYDIRRDLEDETIDALQNFETYYGFFSDEFLEDYIQNLLYKIHPVKLGDGRPGNLGLKILKLNTPNSFCMPTGTIVLTTGLLSTIRSEDELIGILAHEVAHFVLDHQVVNINKAVTRQKRAEFWTGFSTAIAASSEIYLSTKYEYVATGDLTFATAILSGAIANSINERIGANYNIEQEFEADNAAMLSLSFLGKDPRALSAALSRIYSYCTLNGDYYALTGSGTHPALSSRVQKIGLVDPDKYNTTAYDQMISFVNTHNSISEYGLKHFETTLNLTSRNIESGAGTEDDYILKAMTLRQLYDTPEKYSEALDLINKAKVLNITPHSYVFKQEGLTLFRLGKQKEAGEAFATYLKSLETEQDNSSYFYDEIEWTRKMIHKISILQVNE